MTDDVVPGAAQVWSRLADRFPATGLWPLLLNPLAGDDRRPWDDGELDRVAESDVDALDTHTSLATGWRDSLVPWGDNPGNASDCCAAGVRPTRSRSPAGWVRPT